MCHTSAILENLVEQVILEIFKKNFCLRLAKIRTSDGHDGQPSKAHVTLKWTLQIFKFTIYSRVTDQSIHYCNDLQGQINEFFAFGSVNYYCSNTTLQKFAGCIRICDKAYMLPQYRASDMWQINIDRCKLQHLFLNTGVNVTNRLKCCT